MRVWDWRCAFRVARTVLMVRSGREGLLLLLVVVVEEEGSERQVLEGWRGADRRRICERRKLVFREGMVCALVEGGAGASIVLVSAVLEDGCSVEWGMEGGL